MKIRCAEYENKDSCTTIRIKLILNISICHACLRENNSIIIPDPPVEYLKKIIILMHFDNYLPRPSDINLLLEQPNYDK